MDKVKNLGQVFTPKEVVLEMIELAKIGDPEMKGLFIEPASGDGAIVQYLPQGRTRSIEVDGTLDFSKYPDDEMPHIGNALEYNPPIEKGLYKTVISNPPYVAAKDMTSETKRILRLRQQYLHVSDKSGNLYLHFIEHFYKRILKGEQMIFIVPRDFLLCTSGRYLRNSMMSSGRITHIIDMGDTNVFGKYSPNCIIFRYVYGSQSSFTYHKKWGGVWEKRLLLNKSGDLYTCAVEESDGIITHYKQNMRSISTYFNVYVGAVSGADRIYTSDNGDTEFVCSATRKTGKLRKMHYKNLVDNSELLPHKEKLLKRGIRKFDDTNWYEWGRHHHISDKPRIYVNTRTRQKNPFFIHECKNYDGSVLALFPKDDTVPLQEYCNFLNGIDWDKLGFVCDGRYLFSQWSLYNSIIPKFKKHE